LPDVRIIFNGGELRAEVKDFLKDTDGGRILEFEYSGDFYDILERTGNIPLPPYIKRVPDQSDHDRYQTVYAGSYGAVAAPTAGLHFTPALLESLKNNGIERVNLTLNVGIGTFRPISVDDLRQHSMHSESFSVSQGSAELIMKTIEKNKRVVAVGTTTVRTLETIGLPVIPSSGETSIFIYPPYNFKVVSAIITNFHLPRSSLLVMISAFAGRDNVLSAYAYAVKKGFRFFSYGDAMLIV
jgi:S-adenosylmethionine:tRNA ribosyltransferase-isomerase